jgi:RNA polymerase sigma-70 factor, ECF subfamily
MSNSVTETHVESQLAPFNDKLLAFTQVAEKYRAHLLRIARRNPDCHEEAEDIVQDALLQAFRGLQHFRGDARMETWLYSIAQNSVRTYLRSRSKREHISLDHPLNEDEQAIRYDLADSDKNPEEFCELKEMTEIMTVEMDKLNPRCKQILKLCILGELSHRSVAETHHLRVATIKSRIFQAKKMLRRAVYQRCGKPNVS